MSSSRSPNRTHGYARDDYDSRHIHRDGRGYRRSPPSRGYDSHDDYRRRSPPDNARSDYHDSRQSYREQDRRGYTGQRDYTDRRVYRDRDREDYRSPSRSQSRSRSRDRSSRGMRAGQPNKEVMLDGLPLDMTEDDLPPRGLIVTIHGILAKFYAWPLWPLLLQVISSLKRDYNVNDLEEIRIIRDRQTRQSRGFGFIKFPSLDKAEEFVQENYPQIYLSKDQAPGDNEAAQVRIAYSRERSANDPSLEGEWTCQNCTFRNFAGRKVCFRCQASFLQAAQVEVGKPAFVNNGDSDVSTNGTPSQFLVIRGLEASVTEDLLYKGVSKLFKPGTNSGAAQTTNKKGKVSSTTGDASLGAKEGSLRRILLVRDRETAESWRYGFAEYASIDDAQAALTRFNSFEKFTISSKPVFISFIHPGVFVPVLSATEDTEPFTFFPWGNTATRLQYWDENAYVGQLILVDPTANVDNGSRTLSAADEAALAAQKEGIVAVGDEAEAKSKKRKTDVKDAGKPKKSAPAHLEFWSNRHAELHGKKPKPSELGEEKTEANQNTQETAKLNRFIPSYSHPEKHCCYLCSRQFKSGAEVNKHERLSELHKKNLDNEELKTQAIAKMKKAGLPDPTDIDTPEYRDRARERRKVYGSTNNSSTINKISLPMKQPEPEQASKSKGAALLGKMGWNTGEGLGAQGTGMTAPIQTDIYAAGVGLGAQGGKLGDASEEADRNTKGGYAEFVERAKDKAKERYLNMQ